MRFTHKHVQHFLTCAEIFNVWYQLKIALACLCVLPSWIAPSGCTVAKSAVVVITLELFTLEDTLRENMCFHASCVIC